MKGSEQSRFNVEFEDVQFLRATALQWDTNVELTVMIHYGNGHFEVSEGSTSIMSGIVREVEDKNAVLTELPPIEDSTYPMLNKEDFYKELRLRGYHYKGEFQSVINARSDGVESTIRWNNNWVAFMDCILQTMILSKETRALLLPTRIQTVRIFPKKHFALSQDLQMKNENFKVNFNQELNIAQAAGIEIVGLVTNAISRRKPTGKLVLESYKFIEYNSSFVFSQQEAYRICIQLVTENNPSLSSFQVLEVESTNCADLTVTYLEEIFAEIPQVKAKLSLLTDRHVDMLNVTIDTNSISTYTNCHLIVLTEYPQIDSCQKSLIEQGFIIVRIPIESKANNWLTPAGFNLIAKIPTETETIFLLRQRKNVEINHLVVDISNQKEFNWIDKVKDSANTKPLLLVSQNDRKSGIIGLVNCMRREPGIKSVSCFFIDDENAPPFDVTNPLYSSQISLNLAINVYRQVRTFLHS